MLQRLTFLNFTSALEMYRRERSQACDCVYYQSAYAHGRTTYPFRRHAITFLYEFIPSEPRLCGLGALPAYFPEVCHQSILALECPTVM